ncbi:MAG: hypothetical protein ACI9EF_002237 [Pseudohongiellaceae bacterium]|jgi:hypothetical protein
MTTPLCCRAVCAALVILAAPLTAHLLDDDTIVIDSSFHHLGDSATPEWAEAAAEPTAGGLEWSFDAGSYAGERVLAVWERNVNDPWTLTLNGDVFGTLSAHEDQREVFYPVPAKMLRDGENFLRLVPSTTTDDITIGDVRLHNQSLRELLDLTAVTITVSDAESGQPLPARITLRTMAGETPRLHYGEEHGAALRPGLVYTADGEARFELPRGEYDVWASRGTEWSVARSRITVGETGATLALELLHELKLDHMVAVDTHLHTLTYSGHGDASIEERVVTLAGEGVELAIATDHNVNTDYGPVQLSAGLEDWYTSVVGNEVTTSIGHFNGFPFDGDDEIPDHNLRDWVAQVDEMRDHGAEVVILNHPRWPDHQRGPYGVTGLDPFTGARESGAPFTFDAMELVNSTTSEPDPDVLLRDWFSLVGRGEGVVAVGSSDSHTVGDPVGQGRTYVLGDSSDQGHIDVSQVCRNIVAGRCSVSMGIFADLRVADGGGMGDVVAATAGTLDLVLHLAAPTWVRLQTVQLYVNGVEVLRQPVNPMDGVHDEQLPLSIDLPGHDAYIVAAVRGAGIDEPFWPMHNDYTLAVTNPIFADVNGDGSWASPRDVARARHQADSATGRAPQAADLAALDAPTAIHYLTFEAERLAVEAQGRLQSLGEAQAAESHELRGFLESLNDVKAERR